MVISMHSLHLLLLVAGSLIVCVAPRRVITLSNVEPRFDIDGKYVNAHDGTLVEFAGVFYLYGTVYEDCVQHGPVCDGVCGYFNNTFAVYSSHDLLTWTLLNDNVLPA